MSEQTFEVEKLLDINTQDRKILVLVKWVGFDEEENTWEPIQNLGKECAIKLLNDLKIPTGNKKKQSLLLAAV